jgi:hypothetical protein
MAKLIRKIRVFVASPSDVKEEREHLSKAVEELNRVIGQEKNIILELVRWETNVAPDMGRAQAIINRQVGPYDIFIGIMWKRFGTPTGTADSGTQEEFDTAFECWKKTRSPRIMFYFNQAPYTLRTSEEADQVRRVLEFRSQLQKQGLIWEYSGPDEFERSVREHLSAAIRELLVHQRGKTLPFTSTKIAARLAQEPAQELFANAFAEWKRHRAFASRDRLELFLQNTDRIKLTRQQLRFILESWFKSGVYSPQDYVKAYDEKLVVEICTEIIQKEKDADLIDGAIKVLGNQESVQCAEMLLHVIENKKEFQERSRQTAIERFWFSRIMRTPYDRIPKVLMNILQHEPNFKLRKEAAYTLKHYPTGEVVAVLERALRDSNSQVRSNAVDSLGSIRLPSSIDPLLDLLEEETYSIKMRKKIVWALGHFSNDKRVCRVLQSIARSSKEDSQVVKEARWALRITSKS